MMEEEEGPRLRDFAKGRNLWERAAAEWPQQGGGGAADAAGDRPRMLRMARMGGDGLRAEWSWGAGGVCARSVAG
jgi:hypothetical protein